MSQNSVILNFQTQNESEGVCDIVTSGNQSEYSELVKTNLINQITLVKTYFLHQVDAISGLLRFDENQSTTNEYDSYRTRITGSEDTNDTMFSVPLSGIYEMQFR